MSVNGNPYNYHMTHGKMEEALAQYRKENPENEAVKAHEQEIARTQNSALPVMQNPPKPPAQPPYTSGTCLYPAAPSPPPRPEAKPGFKPSSEENAPNPSGYPTLPRMSPRTAPPPPPRPEAKPGFKPSNQTNPAMPQGYPALPRMSPPQQQNPSEGQYFELPKKLDTSAPLNRTINPPPVKEASKNPSEGQYFELPKTLSPTAPLQPTTNPPPLTAQEQNYVTLPIAAPPSRPLQRQRSSSDPQAAPTKPLLTPQERKTAARAPSKTVLNRTPTHDERSTTVAAFDKRGNIAGQGSGVVIDKNIHMTPTELAEFALQKKSQRDVDPYVLKAMQGTLQYHLNQAAEVERNLTGSSKKVHSLAKKLNFVASRRTKKLQEALDHLNRLPPPPSGAASAA